MQPYYYGRQTGFKRKAPGARFTRKQKGKQIVRIRPRQRGYLRRGGFYGRYANGGEKKFLDTTAVDVAVPAAGFINSTINVIPQGVTESERVGRKCTIKNIGFKFNILLPGTTAQLNTSDTVRIIMYLDQQCNGGVAQVSGSGGILETATFQAFRNLENIGRFKVLMDRTYNLASPSGGGVVTTNDFFGEKSVSGSFYKSCNIPIEFDASAPTGALATIRSNNVGLLFITRSARATVNWRTRVRFSDA